MKLVVWRVTWRGRVLVDAAVHLIHAAAVKTFDGRTVVEWEVAGSLRKSKMYINVITFEKRNFQLI
jgi:hypothetical protein